MDAVTFFAQNPVFTRSDWMKAQDTDSSHRTQETRLLYYVKTGRAVMVRRGLYASVPPGVERSSVQVDPFLVCAKVFADSVIAYHAAMELHGWAYSLHNRFEFLARADVREFQFHGVEYQPVFFPKKLQVGGHELDETEIRDRAGQLVRVTSLERTLVDALDRPALAGGWEEIWRSMGSVEYFDGVRIVRYVEKLGNATTAAKVGYFLQEHSQSLPDSDGTLRKLEELKPRQVRRLTATHREDDRFIARWNLIVPSQLADQTWEEQQ